MVETIGWWVRRERTKRQIYPISANLQQTCTHWVNLSKKNCIMFETAVRVDKPRKVASSLLWEEEFDLTSYFSRKMLTSRRKSNWRCSFLPTLTVDAPPNMHVTLPEQDALTKVYYLLLRIGNRSFRLLERYQPIWPTRCWSYKRNMFALLKPDGRIEQKNLPTLVYTDLKKSDTLLLFLEKRNWPGTIRYGYREQKGRRLETYREDMSKIFVCVMHQVQQDYYTSEMAHSIV